MTRALIIDDEALARAALGRKLAEVDPSLEVHEADGPHGGLAALRTLKPELVFLDIAMPGMSGFDLLSHLAPEERDFALVFCTAYAEHAVQAFEAAALDYLLKPVETPRLAEALRRAAQKTAAWSLPQKFLEKLAVRTRKGVAVVPVDSIVEAASEAHETVIYTATTEYVSELSLTELEGRLDPARFFRCHRAHLVQVALVREIHIDVAVVGPAARHVPVSRRRRGVLLEMLKG